MKTISVLYCLLYAAGIEGADINVEGFKGGEVSFQCSHRLARKNDKYLCKDPCKGSEDMLATVQSGRGAKSGKITLVDTGEGVFTVTFSQLQLSDSGTYWCAVDRPGFDTFTAVHLSIQEADETTTVLPELSPTWTYQYISNLTLLTSVMDTRRSANLSTATNSTNGEGQEISTGTVLYATVGAVAMLTVLVLAMIARKRKKKSKPQPQVCSNSTDHRGADERQANCEYDEIGEEVQSIKGSSKRFPCAHHPKQDPPTALSPAAEFSTPLHIYENICCSKHSAHAANVQNEHDIDSRIYIKPLPPERTGDSCLRIHTNKPTASTNATRKPAESCTSNASTCPSSSCSDSTEVRPRSLWFGLDLSGTV